METVNDFFSNDADATSMAENHELNSHLSNFNFPGPKDEDDTDEGNGNQTGNDDPPIDDDVVHSPVPTQPGGKPNG